MIVGYRAVTKLQHFRDTTFPFAACIVKCLGVIGSDVILSDEIFQLYHEPLCSSHGYGCYALLDTISLLAK